MRTAEDRGLIQEVFLRRVSTERSEPWRLTAPFTNVLKINEGRTKDDFSSEAGGGGRNRESLVWNLLNLRCLKFMFVKAINVALALGNRLEKRGGFGDY